MQLPADLLAQLEQTVIERMRVELARREPVPEWLSDKSVARYCDISERTAKAWRLERGLRYTLIGGNVRVRRSDLDNWLDAHPKSASR